MPDVSTLNLNRLVIFVHVVEAGTLTAAANRLGIAKTVVSAHMQKLEAEVGAALLVRTTRRLALTEAGETFYEACRRIVSDTQAALEAAALNTAEPRGTLRVTAPIDYGASIVAPVAVELRKRYPALRIELLTADHVQDLIAENIDVAIRVGRLADSGHRAVKIGSFSEWLVAAPEFLRRHRPAEPEDLRALPLVALAVLPQPDTWTFRRDATQRTIHFETPLSATTAHAVRLAALAGGGLAVLPDFACVADVKAKRLVRVLPEWKLPGGGIHAVFPDLRYRPQKTRVFIEALRARVGA
ncbi:LysR family transcriptional regulator [Massilia arenosa]|uniref:LysR family transcriptional regulator n=1 Tax=Zemynaea arenosa TaxID=2561931 RepID=A0A4Y9SE77_9BURK|nr:LysR family transcriptional regulator [Massilia arenosa]TFW21252.1 LysR family transcriptional regulator [Massilia arenosa]